MHIRTTYYLLFLLLILPPTAFGQEVLRPAEENFQNEDRKEIVVLLHGLARHKDSLDDIEDVLKNSGYKVVNEGYPSRDHTIDVLVDSLLAPRLRKIDLEGEQKINFVTHSMGGILVRYLAKQHPDIPVGRVVMLSPPNKGSELVDTFKRLPLIAKSINGPAFFQLGTGKDSFVNQLGPVDFELGIITGTRTWNAVFSTIIPGNDDGKVSVNNSKIEGMSDFITIYANHTFIMNNEEVIRQTLHFLGNAEFDHQES